MSSDVSILIDGVEEGDRIYLDSLALVEAANGGEVGIGGFNVSDTTLEAVPAHKTVIVTDGRASPTQVLSGFTADRNIERGREGTIATRRTFDVTVVDLNTVLDDEIFRHDGANRPAETDYERMTWLLTTDSMVALGITAGVLPNTNTVNLDATDYRGEGPRAVANDCAEAAQKNCFVYDFGAGSKLYYDKHTGTSLSSALSLSSVLADVDNSTVFALESPKLERDPAEVYSTIRLKYKNGVVWATNATTETNFRRREFSVTNERIKTRAKAQAMADALLAAAANEKETFSCAVTLPAANVNDIRAGQRIQIKCPHLDIDAFTWFRIIRREVTPAEGQEGASDERYSLRLEFAEDIAIGFGSSGGNDSPPVPIYDTGGDTVPCGATTPTPTDVEINFGPTVAQYLIFWRGWLPASSTIQVTWDDVYLYFGGNMIVGSLRDTTVYFQSSAAWNDINSPPSELDTEATGDDALNIVSTLTVAHQSGAPAWDGPRSSGSGETFGPFSGQWAALGARGYRTDGPFNDPGYLEYGVRGTFHLLGDATCGNAGVAEPTSHAYPGEVYGPVTLAAEAGVYTFPYPFVRDTLLVFLDGIQSLPTTIDEAVGTFSFDYDAEDEVVTAYARIDPTYHASEEA